MNTQTITYKVYWLINNKTREPFYVGATRKAYVSVRRREHVHDAKHGLSHNDRKNFIIKSIDFDFSIVVVDEVSTEKESRQLECYWANQLKAWGFDICNSHYIKPALYAIRKGYKNRKHISIANSLGLWKSLKYSEVVDISTKSGYAFPRVRAAFLKNKFPIGIYNIIKEISNQSA